MKRLWLLLLLLVSCTPQFEDPTRVIDLRVLAVTADPPETLLDVGPLATVDRLPSTAAEVAQAVAVVQAWPESFPPITVRTLIADPRGQGRPVRVSAVVCLGAGRERERDEGPGGVGDTTRIGAGCSVLATLHEGFEVQPERQGDPMLTAAFTFTPTRALLERALLADHGLGLFFNLPLVIETTVSAGAETVVARKRVVFAPRLRPDQTANANPRLTRVGVRVGSRDAPSADVDLDGPPLPATTRLLFRPEGSAEIYQAREYDRTTGRLFTREGIKEVLRFSFVGTAGSFSPRSMSTESSPLRGPATEEQTIDYQPPRGPTPDRLVPAWIVVRDERGGASLTRLSLLLP